MSSTKPFVDRLKKVSELLEKAATWNGSGLAVDAKSDDFVYELMCYFHIAVCASGAYSCSIGGNVHAPAKGKKKAKWPKKPALKENFSYISLSEPIDGSEAFQLCPGIEVSDKHGKARAPDVNLLGAGAPDRPSFGDLHACWDAKHTNRDGSRLPDTAVSDFAFTYQQLGRPCPPATWTRRVTDVVCKKSGLLTNGNESTEPLAVLQSYGIAETSFFPLSPVTRS
ncbi:hypothetical protein MCEZEM1_00069 [Comamonadaceae bacterium]